MKKNIIFLLVGILLVVSIVSGIYFYKQSATEHYVIGYVGGDKIHQFVDAKAGAICWVVNGDLTCLSAKALGIEKRELTRGEWEEYLITTMRRR